MDYTSHPLNSPKGNLKQRMIQDLSLNKISIIDQCTNCSPVLTAYSPPNLSKEQRELGHIQILLDFEQRIISLKGKNTQLKHENSVLKRKISIMQEEKNMHAQAHANEKSHWKTEKRELTCGFSKAKQGIHDEFKEVLNTIEQVKQGFDGMTTSPKAEYKVKLVTLERVYKERLSKRDKKIRELEAKLSDYTGRKCPTKPRSTVNSPRVIEKLIQELDKKEISLRRRVKALKA